MLENKLAEKDKKISEQKNKINELDSELKITKNVLNVVLKQADDVEQYVRFTFGA